MTRLSILLGADANQLDEGRETLGCRTNCELSCEVRNRLIDDVGSTDDEKVGYLRELQYFCVT